MIESREILLVSSGVLSTLTNERSYDKLEQIRADWLNWFTNQEREFKNWQECWTEYEHTKQNH